MQQRRRHAGPARESARPLRLVQDRSNRARAHARRRRLRPAGNVLLLVAALVTAYLVFLAMMRGR